MGSFISPKLARVFFCLSAGLLKQPQHSNPLNLALHMHNYSENIIYYTYNVIVLHAFDTKLQTRYINYIIIISHTSFVSLPSGSGEIMIEI